MLTTNAGLGRRLRIAGLVILGVLIGGSLGYMLIEQWPFLDAAYMTIITLSTVGYTEVRPLSSAGRVFTILLIVVGAGSAAYLLSSLADYLIAGELYGTLKRRRMQRAIDTLKDHYIVCGYGRVGEQVVRELVNSDVPVVVIERNAALLESLNDSHIPYLVGDASDDEVLRQAGIERAKGLVAATGGDADNVFITLSARALKRDLTIVARGIMPDAERKLRKAGANHVILPHAIGGRRMAGILLRPSVVDFLDVVMHSQDLELWLEEIALRTGSALCNLTVSQANIRARTGANVLAIKTAAGQLLTNVSANYTLTAKDVLIALGTRQQLRELCRLAGSTRDESRLSTADAVKH